MTKKQILEAIERHCNTECNLDGDVCCNVSCELHSSRLEKIKRNKVKLLKAIREHCLECCGGVPRSVSACNSSKTCALWPFRMGQEIEGIQFHVDINPEDDIENVIF